jgi:hypothetical protein
MKSLLHAIYYNWDKLKDGLKSEHYFKSFKDILDYLKSGDQEEQTELENFVRGMGIEIVDFEDKRTWNLR